MDIQEIPFKYKNIFFPVKLVQHWHTLPREVVPHSWGHLKLNCHKQHALADPALSSGLD